MLSPAGLLSLRVPLVLLGVFPTALHFVISSAVEQGIRRSLPESSPRPSFRELRCQRRERERDW